VLAAFDTREPLRIPAGFRPTHADIVGFFEARLAHVLSVVFEDAATARLVLRAGRGTDGVVDDILRRIDEAVLGVVEAELRAGKEAGVLRPLDERFVARFFVGGIEKIVLSYLDEDRPIDVQTIAHQAALLEALGILPRGEKDCPEPHFDQEKPA
jgi:hypothetical protein